MSKKQKSNIIYVYRYLFRYVGNELANVRVLAGSAEEHENFKDMLIHDDKVLSANCEYLHEVNVDNLYQVDTFKKEKDNKEEK